MTGAPTAAGGLMPAAGPSRGPGGRGQPAVACQGLTKVFKDFWLRDRARAVDGVSFEINRGEIFGLLGPNGSGKSTTIKILLGLLRPTRGRVVVFGKAPTDVKTKRRVGYLPEESYLYGFLDARETLDYYGKLFELDGRTRRARIDELLEMVGLTHAAGRAVRDFSKGMQRRIGIAQALINDPDLLILDEPTTGLDPIGTRQIKDLILELGRRGKTVLLSSHLLSDVEDVVDRMVILYGGKIRGQGTCEELLEKRSVTTIEADELDEATINEIDRVIRSRSEGERGVRRVSHPRQKLEELFLDIVARAQAERLATSGATHGGQTAAFLRAQGEGEGDGESGEAMIRSLVEAGAGLPPAEVEPAARVEGDESGYGGPADGAGAARVEAQEAEATIRSLLGDLVAESAADPATERATGSAGAPAGTGPGVASQGPRPAPPPVDVDEDVIGSLLDGNGRGADGHEPGAERR